ncbi:Hypothetical predicted protein [Mytilus galloprovincialis]|uniref:Uncharacterized protein n=1 Tax=Mytilus galloprovincialis TaxID=29158 RepID=A0A8B6CR43_MYTGA|nr:Hypothetical predicted protein [Mytilus galloprovincialis]
MNRRRKEKERQRKQIARTEKMKRPPDDIEVTSWITKYLKNQADLSEEKKKKMNKCNSNVQADSQLLVGLVSNSKTVNMSHLDTEHKKCRKRKLETCDASDQIDSKQRKKTLSKNIHPKIHSNTENPVEVHMKKKLLTRHRVKLHREKRDLQKVLNERLKDKARKQTTRNNRRRITIESDRSKDKSRKTTQREKRDEISIASHRSKDKVKKKTERELRDEITIDSDKRKDEGRKRTERKNRDDNTIDKKEMTILLTLIKARIKKGKQLSEKKEMK